MPPTLAASAAAVSAPAQAGRPRAVVRMGTDADRDAIYRMRHAVYARELGQHAPNGDGVLHDTLDAFNTYVVATVNGALAGFVSITPPGRTYSVDKYFTRAQMPFELDGGTYEIRLLTVDPALRHRTLAPLLMYAAFRWIESRGGTHVVALGRDGVLSLYAAAGMRPAGPTVRAGAVLYHLLHAPAARVRDHAPARTTERLRRGVAWTLPLPFHPPARCYHGGAFFQAVGDGFDDLSRRHDVVNADVLDAWFPPAPGVLDALREHGEWLARTSPPTQCEGMVRAVARARGVDPACVLVGAGSSDLIFLALREWLRPESRVLILDPMYGEYAHVLEHVVGCRVDRMPLLAADGYALDVDAWAGRVAAGGYDLAVLVNPNSPTGRHVPRAALEAALHRVPPRTRVWIDETYAAYAGPAESVAALAAGSPNVVACTSMSKVYALSGLRAAYLVACADTVAELRAVTPPWAVGLPAQVAAVRALEDPAYYRGRWAQTHALREALASAVRTRCGVATVPGVANFVLCHLPPGGPTAAQVVARARQHNVFLRDAAGMGTAMGTHALRIAVKDAATNERIVHVLAGIVT